MKKKECLVCIICVSCIMLLIFWFYTFRLPCEELGSNPYCSSYYLFFDKQYPDKYIEITTRFDISNRTLYFDHGLSITLPEEYKGKIGSIQSMGSLLDMKTKKKGFLCFSYRDLQEGCILLKDHKIIETAEYEKVDEKTQYKKQITVIEILDFENPATCSSLKLKKPLEASYIIWILISLILLRRYELSRTSYNSS